MCPAADVLPSTFWPIEREWVCRGFVQQGFCSALADIQTAWNIRQTIETKRGAGRCGPQAPQAVTRIPRRASWSPMLAS